MWKVFSNNKNSIAISTTKIKLINNIQSDKKIHVERVHYADLKNTFQDINLGMKIYVSSKNTINIKSDILYGLCSNNVLLRKTNYFYYENELRLYFEDSYGLDTVQFVPLELNSIIDEIIISPNCDSWFLDILNNILKKYNITNLIKYSDIMDNTITLSKDESKIAKDILNVLKFERID